VPGVTVPGPSRFAEDSRQAVDFLPISLSTPARHVLQSARRFSNVRAVSEL